jgi:hypothetical protein
MRCDFQQPQPPGPFDVLLAFDIGEVSTIVRVMTEQFFDVDLDPLDGTVPFKNSTTCGRS